MFLDTAGAANRSSSGAEVYSAAASAMAFSRLAASRASLSDLSFSFLSLLAITAAAFSASILILCCFTCASQKQTRQPRSNPQKVGRNPGIYPTVLMRPQAKAFVRF